MKLKLMLVCSLLMLFISEICLADVSDIIAPPGGLNSDIGSVDILNQSEPNNESKEDVSESDIVAPPISDIQSPEMQTQEETVVSPPDMNVEIDVINQNDSQMVDNLPILEQDNGSPQNGESATELSDIAPQAEFNDVSTESDTNLAETLNSTESSNGSTENVSESGVVSNSQTTTVTPTEQSAIKVPFIASEKYFPTFWILDQNLYDKVFQWSDDMWSQALQESALQKSVSQKNVVLKDIPIEISFTAKDNKITGCVYLLKVNNKYRKFAQFIGDLNFVENKDDDGLVQVIWGGKSARLAVKSQLKSQNRTVVFRSALIDLLYKYVRVMHIRQYSRSKVWVDGNVDRLYTAKTKAHLKQRIERGKFVYVEKDNAAQSSLTFKSINSKGTHTGDIIFTGIKVRQEHIPGKGVKVWLQDAVKNFVMVDGDVYKDVKLAKASAYIKLVMAYAKSGFAKFDAEIFDKTKLSQIISHKDVELPSNIKFEYIEQEENTKVICKIGDNPFLVFYDLIFQETKTKNGYKYVVTYDNSSIKGSVQSNAMSAKKDAMEMYLFEYLQTKKDQSKLWTTIIQHIR